MNQSNLDESGKQFLLELFKKTNGDASTKVSMYEIGDTLGLDKAQANFITTELVGFDYVEIKTLSGGIGITSQGLDAARSLGAGGGKKNETFRLGNDLILNGDKKNVCDMMVADVKSQVAKGGMDFDSMAEIMADLKTIESQLSSPKPKTVIIRETFRSVHSVLTASGKKEIADRIQELIE